MCDMAAVGCVRALRSLYAWRRALILLLTPVLLLALPLVVVEGKVRK